jgi:steroid 5-alpha reductase family enzyme
VLLASGAAGLAHPALILMIVWALRLSLHITLRGWGEPEDCRYQIIRARNQPNFAFKSLYLVFALQAVLAWIVSFPLMVIADVGSAEPVSRWLFVCGLVVAVGGLVYEAVADRQLAVFARDAANHGQVMTGGLWRYSRHPNYFGEFIFWWGMFFAVIGLAGAGAAWTVLSPLLMSMLLLKVSGVPMLEHGIAERRPGYRAYVLGTNAFFPGASRLGGAGHD